MRDDYTHLVVIIDASGSMESLTSETISGVNDFFKDQKKVKGKATVTTVTFNTDVVYVHEGDNLKNIKPLNRTTYRTGGYTALLKAVDDTIEETGKFLASLPEEDRPAKVIVMIVTDGAENASPYPYSKARLAGKINQQRDVYKWEFLFLGANQDAIAEGKSLGVRAENALNYAANAFGTQAIYQTLSNNVMGVRSAKGFAAGASALNFTDEQRTKAMGKDS